MLTYLYKFTNLVINIIMLEFICYYIINSVRIYVLQNKLQIKKFSILYISKKSPIQGDFLYLFFYSENFKILTASSQILVKP